MKWSEQMRELLSEDEHYNQLKLNTDTRELFINDELIAVLNDIAGTGATLENHKFIKIIKKYPFFTDIKFLLNCIFTQEGDNFISYSKCNIIRKYKDRYEICNAPTIITLTIYIKKPELS